MNIQSKTALVTGGAQRVGKAIALELAKAGANLVINYNSSAAAAQETVAEAGAFGVQALAVQCDISDLSAVQAMVGQIRQHFGGLDILVNSADYFGKHPFPTDDYSTWQRVISTSVNGSFYVSNECAPLLLAGESGAVVNIVDLSAWQPWPGFTAHAVAKAGLMALTQQMALELAPTVRVNAVAPGPVLAPPDYSEKQKKAVAERTLLKRWGRAEDVAHAVRFLVEADYITGDVIFVDGGERFGSREIVY
ncbi:MAG: SDR family oxidoreductase [Caldilineaceae bacterium]|nr:SDR family oxidoreductase [Caldilineaceae bacterium]HRJ44181.1 SDR family NAD(P)-dependent oxidoreductase [Caldilineaceae bacterium]